MINFQRIFQRLLQHKILKSKVFLLGAAVVFINMVLIVSRYSDYQKTLQAQQYTKVFTVKYLLHRAMIISKDQLDAKDIKITDTTPNDLKESDISFSIGGESDLVATKRVKPGDTLTKLNTMSRNDKNYISKILRPHHRAATIPVPKERIESTSIIPGNRINIGIAIREKDKTVGKRVLCGIKVMEITKSAIVVELDAAGENTIAAALKEGELTFSVMPDSENGDNRGVNCSTTVDENPDDSITIIKGKENGK